MKFEKLIQKIKSKIIIYAINANFAFVKFFQFTIGATTIIV